MSFSLPVMPLTCNVWRVAAGRPPVGAPAATFLGNLAWGKRVGVPSTGGTSTLGVVLMTMTLLCPTGTHFVSDANLVTADTVEVPAGSGRHYLVAFADYIGQGFPNQHIGALLVQYTPGVGTP